MESAEGFQVYADPPGTRSASAGLSEWPRPMHDKRAGSAPKSETASDLPQPCARPEGFEPATF